MSNEQDDKLDKLLRSKLTRKDFVLKDEYWQNARRMVAESRPVPGPRPLKYGVLIIAGILVALVSVATINYSISKKQTARRQAATNGNTQVAAEQREVAPATIAKPENAPGSVSSPASTPVKQNAAPNALLRGGNELPQTREANSKQMAAKTTKTLPARHSNTNKVKVKQPAVHAANTTGLKQRHIAGVERPVPLTTTGNAQPLHSLHSQKQWVEGVSPQLASGPVAAAQPASQAATVAPGEPGLVALSALPGKEGTPEMQIAATAQEPALAAPATPASASATDAVQTKQLPATRIPMLWEISQPSLSGSHTAVAYESSKPAKGFRGFKLLEAGLTYYNPSGNAADNISYHLAAKYGFHLGKRTDFSVGIGYTRQHQNKGKRVYNIISYDLGEQIQTIGVNTVRLDYIELPLTVYYAIHGRHGIAAGASFNYLVHSADLLKKPDQTTYDHKANGYFGAFSPFDVQLNIGYTYMLSSRIMLTGSYHYGVVDISRNRVFRSGSYTNNTGARLTIGYQLH